MRETAANKFKSIASSEQNSGDETFGFHLANRKPVGSSGCYCLLLPQPRDIGSGLAQSTTELLRAPTRAFCNKLWFMGCLWSGWSLCDNKGESVTWLREQGTDSSTPEVLCSLCPHATSASLADNMIPLVIPSLVHDQQIRSDGCKLISSFYSEGAQVWSCPCIANASPLMLLLPALVKCRWISLFRVINSLSDPQYEPNAEPGVMELGDEICGQNLGNIQFGAREAWS